MATAADLRRIALSLEGAAERPHMDRSAFFVKRTFATLASDGLSANLKFTVEEQSLKSLTHPEGFEPLQNGWGRQGWTRVNLVALDTMELEAALRVAHAHALPGKVIRAKSQ